VKLGLRAKIVLIVVGAVLIGLVAVLSTSTYLFTDAYISSLHSRSTAIAQGLKTQMDRILQLGIDLDSLVGFDRQCKDVVDTYDGIEFAMVTGRDGAILFHSNASKSGGKLVDRGLLAAVRTAAESTSDYTSEGASGHASVVPIFAIDGAHLGSVVVGLSARVIDDKVRKIVVAVLGVGLLFLMVGTAALVVVLSYSISRPMNVLINSIELIRSNTADLSRRVELRSEDELGTLARAFNDLMQSLQDTTVSKASLAAAYDALRESEAKYRELVSNANAIILRMGLDGTVTYFNEYAERFFGYSAAEILGRHVVGTIVPRLESTTGRDLSGMVSAILADPNKYGTNENENVTRDGRRVFVRWANRIILGEHDQPVGVLCIGQDVTEKRQADRELELYHHHLEDLVQERTTALSMAKEAADVANRAKTVFLANMSHELRTPLNAIMGMTDLALRGATDPQQADRLAKVAQAARQLLGIIGNILEISELEAERFNLEQIDFKLDGVLDDLGTMVGPKAAAKGLKLVIDAPPDLLSRTLRGDPVRLRQILLNLTGNAIKFTGDGSVTVRAAATEESSRDMVLRFDVRDTGIGISTEDQRRLFAAFEQADGSTTRKYGGAGLELAICKRLVDMMGGSIGVESALGAGSTFWFSVRLGKADASPDREPAPIASGAEKELKARYSGARVLLAEDEPINQEVSRALLEVVGLQVDLAEDGVQAVEMANGTDYDLILMDMQMPKLNGVAATKAIRALPGRENTAILALTANAFTSDRQRCLEAGMNDFITKPVDPELLFQAILKALSQAKQDLPQASAQ
jgi:PAS domain S-box-containing protein